MIPSEPSDCCSGPDCREAVEQLYGYLDGMLDDARRTVIKSHLDGCPECFEAYGFHYELKVVVSRRCQTELPESLRARVLAALEAFDQHD